MKDKKIGQLEAVSHIRALLTTRGLNLPSRPLRMPDRSSWLIFEHKSRSVGVDPEAGVWTWEPSATSWQCLEKACTVSGAALAVEFLIKD